MSCGIANFLFQQRESAARIAALVAGVLMIVGQARLVILPVQKNSEEPIRVELRQVKPEPPPEPPKPKLEPVEKPRVPVKKAVIPMQKPVAEVPAPAVMPVAVPVQTAQPAPVANPAPAQQARIASNGESERSFARGLRQKIESHKVYPREALSLGMTGSVTLLYVIDRLGRLLKVEIVSSSGSRILDQAALQAVRATTFQAMPEDAWVGEAQKEFKTKIDFEIDN
ncbi:MAG: energy transducer TonB [Burkholderiales bacterium]|nr:energy transducer TonB [Burkholderiales bacterium]